MRIYRFMDGGYYYIFFNGKILNKYRILSDYDIKD